MLDADNQIDHSFHICYTKEAEFLIVGMILSFSFIDDDKSGFYSDVKEHVLTEANKQKAKKGLKIAGIVFGIILLVDPISFIIYAAVFGLPQ